MDVDIEQLRTGDRTAWERAYAILKAISLSVCYAAAPNRNHQDHEDIAAEAITEVVGYIEKVGSFEECKKLVVTISKNRLIDLFRHDSADMRDVNLTESLEAKEGFDAVDPSQVRPDVAVIKAEQWVMVKELMKQVPEKYRNVVADYYFHDLTQQKIAEKRRLRIGSIGVYLKRGLKALAKNLKKRELLPVRS